MLEVYTSQFKYRESDRLDITVKTGDKVFSPTWDIVMGYKNGRLTEEQYTEKYLALMRKSYRTNQQHWQQLLSRERVVLICYCRSGEFCHRKILARILEKLGAKYCGEI